MNRLSQLSLVILTILGSAHAYAATPDTFEPPASSPEQWYTSGAQTADDLSDPPVNGRQAKNIILFIGDGMGISTITAARILKGQQPDIIGTGQGQHAQSGEETLLSFENFPWRALSKVYSVDQQTPDSAPTMTAMVTGIKTLGDHVGVDQTVPMGVTTEDCLRDLSGHSPKTILELSEDHGKSTGVISTARITHATPAATYAHTSNRDWESDANLPGTECRVHDIARQLVEFEHGDGIDVIFGGGRANFRPNSENDREYTTKKGNRKDNRDLIAEWLRQQHSRQYVETREGFQKINPTLAHQVMGLFEPSHMQYEADRNRSDAGEPSLTEMTDTAVRMLSRNPKGFFLHVEAGRIDQAHHVGNAYRALTDTIALSDAVEKTQKTLKELGLLDETLIIVTADHSHVFTIAGYPVRGNNILGKVIAFDHPKEGYALADDHLPYATLSYANGPGFNAHSAADGPGYASNAGRKEDLSAIDTSDKDFHQQSLVPLKHGSETHAGEDVAIYATGPQAYRFRGTLENNVIFHIMHQAFGFDSAGGR